MKIIIFYFLSFVVVCGQTSDDPAGHGGCPCRVISTPCFEGEAKVANIEYFKYVDGSGWPITVTWDAPSFSDGVYLEADYGLDCFDDSLRVEGIIPGVVSTPQKQVSDFYRTGSLTKVQCSNFTLRWRDPCSFSHLVKVPGLECSTQNGSTWVQAPHHPPVGPPHPKDPPDDDDDVIVGPDPGPPENCGGGDNGIETEPCPPYENEDTRESQELSDPYALQLVSENVSFGHSKTRFEPYIPEQGDGPATRYLKETIQTSFMLLPPQDGEEPEPPESQVGGTIVRSVCRMTGKVVVSDVSGNPAWSGGGGQGATSPTTARSTHRVSSYNDPPNCEADGDGIITVNSELSEEYTTDQLKQDVYSHIWDFRGDGFFKRRVPFAKLDLSDDELDFDYQKSTYKWRLPSDEVRFPRPYIVHWAEVIATEGQQEIEFKVKEYEIIDDESPDYILDLKPAETEGYAYVIPAPIEIIEVNSGDADSDGIPDYADGLSDKFADKGGDPNAYFADDSSSDDSREYAESAEFDRLVTIYPFDSEQYETITIDLFDNESNPEGMVWTGPLEDEAWPVELPEGAMRVWTKEAREDRSILSVTEGGDYVPSGEAIQASLLEGKTLYVEIVKPSETEGDYKVSVIGRPSDGESPDEVLEFKAYSAISTTFQLVGENEELRTLDAPASSLPTPVVNLTNVSVANVYPSPDGTELLADVRVSTTIRSSVCDLEPDAEISNVFISMNNDGPSLRSVGLNVSKNPSDDLYRPYPYSGSLNSELIVGLPVIEGNNVLRVMAHDPIYRLSGEAYASFLVEATEPGGGTGPGGGVVAREFKIDFSANPPEEQSSCFLSVDIDGQAVVTNQLLVKNGIGQYESDDQRYRFSPTRLPQFDSTIVDSLSGLLCVDFIKYKFSAILETSPASRIFLHADTGQTGSYGDYSNWSATAGPVSIETQSLEDDVYSPMVICLDGPENLLKHVEKVELYDEEMPVVEQDGVYLVGRIDDPEKVATIVSVPLKIIEAADAQQAMPYPDYPSEVDGEDEELDGLAPNQLEAVAELYERAEPELTADELIQRLLYAAESTLVTNITDKKEFQYYRGLGAGFMGNPKDTGSALLGFGKKAVGLLLEYGTLFHPTRIAWEFTFGDRYQGEMKSISDGFRRAARCGSKVAKYWGEVEQYFNSLFTNGNLNKQVVINFLATGELPGGGSMSGAMKTAIQTVLLLFVDAADWWNGLSPYKRGYYQGYIMFEVVAVVVAGVITAEVGGAGAAVLLARHLPKLGKVLGHVSKGLNKLPDADNIKFLISKIDDFVANIGKTKAEKWCFVGGTMICTAQGMVPIEKIELGDIVLSAHETTGEISLRPVIDLYQNKAAITWTVAYDHDNDFHTPPEKLTCSGEHPFWVEEEAAFVPAEELQMGQSLRLVNGLSAEVTSVISERGPPSGVEIYNFAVAEHHTYFAGAGGVWVHNLCKKLKEEYVGHHDIAFRKHLDDGKDLQTAWDDAIEEVVERAAKTDARINDDLELEQLAMFLIGNTPTDWGVRLMFGQKRIAPNFRKVSPGHPDILGKPIAEVAEMLKTGALSADDIPIFYFVRNGEAITVNNRGLAALTMAGKKVTKMERVDPHPDWLARLDELPIDNWHEVPGNRIAVTEFKDGSGHIYSIFRD